MPPCSTAIVTDSSSQLTAGRAAELGVAVVPITITIDGVDHLEGVDLGPDEFARIEPEAMTITTAQPAPVAFLDAFEAAARHGADDVVVILVGSGLSGAADSCRVAAELAPIPVRIVDTGTSSYGVAMCVEAAVAALESGGGADAAVAAAEHRAAELETVFIVQGLELPHASGRFSMVDLDAVGTDVPVLWASANELEVIASVRDLDAAVDAMATKVVAAGIPVRVASGLAAARDVTESLEARLAAHPLVVELIRYRVGPSIVAHTGSGTAGVFYHPAPDGQ